MLVNAHDHFEFYKDIESGISTIEKYSIHTLVNSSTPQEYLQLKNKYSNPLIKIGLGMHPWKVETDTELSEFEKEVAGCDFIGEIGLDFYWDKRTNLYPKQIEIFENIIDLAVKYNKVTNIHTKGAELKVLEILSKYRPKNPIIHWYSSELNLLSEYLQLGCYFTIGPDVKFSETTDKIIELVPLEKMLTETDGATSIEWAINSYHESDYILTMLRYISEIKNIDQNVLKEQIYNNYLTVFKNDK